MPIGGQELMQRMAGGDRDAFAAFYDRYAPLAFALILRIVRDRADASEVLQDAFWEAWEVSGAYEPGRGTSEAWVTALAEGEETLARLAGQDQPVIPPAAVRQALLARIAASPRGASSRAPIQAPAGHGPGSAHAGPPARAWWFPWVTGAVAASLLAFFTGMFVAARYEARLGQMAREAAALATRIRAQETALQRELDGANRLVDLLRDPSTRVVALTGQGSAAGASGRVIWSEAQGGHLYVSSLGPLPPDKTYELWAISGGTPRPAGLLAVDASGRGGHRVEPVRGERPVEAFAVTIEPAGGVPAPTGPIVLASK